jgi:hypothetical protein
VDVNLDEFSLGCFEVDCDGSACGSRSAGRHVHPPDRGIALARVYVRDGKRVRYTDPVKIMQPVDDLEGL